MEEKAKKIAELLKLLANEHRLLILCALVQGPLTVGEIHSFTANRFEVGVLPLFQIFRLCRDMSGCCSL